MREVHFKPIFLSILCLFCFTASLVEAQTPFFKSEVTISEEQLDGFFTSFTYDDDQIYFIANDYHLYAFDMKSGNLKWQYSLSYKSDLTPVAHQKSIFVTENTNEDGNKTVQLNAKTGEIIQTLKISSIYTQPVFKDSVMYCTALDDGGKILAYDLKDNKIIWSHFVAHGVSEQPYFFQDELLANSEGEDWLALDYKGNFLEKKCDSKFNIDTTEVCIRQFRWLNYKGDKLENEALENYETVKIKHTKDRSIAMTDDKIFFLGRKNKVLHILNMYDIELPEEDFRYNNYFELFKVENDNIWFFYQNHLVVYDYKSKKILKLTDLSQWNPHQIILENSNLWLISKDDGELYGLRLDDTK